MLITWLSYADLAALVRCARTAPKVEHTIVFGASANRHRWWDNHAAAHRGWTPRDSREGFRARIKAMPSANPDDPAVRFQGGAYVKMGPDGDA